ncbi:MAG: SEC-C metal-binding domain-containing protein, partial [Desulfobulbales bacterium]
MGKIGRNETCPCGSGRKFKRCCLGKQQNVSSNLTEVQKTQISLQNAISTIQKA